MANGQNTSGQTVRRRMAHWIRTKPRRRQAALALGSALLLLMLALSTYGGIALLRGTTRGAEGTTGSMGSMPGMDTGSGSANAQNVMTAAAAAQGNQPLQPMLMDEVKMFALSVSQVH